MIKWSRQFLLWNSTDGVTVPTHTLPKLINIPYGSKEINGILCWADLLCGVIQYHFRETASMWKVTTLNQNNSHVTHWSAKERCHKTKIRGDNMGHETLKPYTFKVKKKKKKRYNSSAIRWMQPKWGLRNVVQFALVRKNLQTHNVCHVLVKLTGLFVYSVKQGDIKWTYVTSQLFFRRRLSEPARAHHLSPAHICAFPALPGRTVRAEKAACLRLFWGVSCTCKKKTLAQSSDDKLSKL